MKKSNTVEEQDQDGAEKVAQKKSPKKLAKRGMKTTAKKKVSSRISKTGKYTSIRHMMESLFRDDKELTFDKVIKVVKREYPNSAYNRNHFSWYHNKIVSNGKTKNR